MYLRQFHSISSNSMYSLSSFLKIRLSGRVTLPHALKFIEGLFPDSLNIILLDPSTSIKKSFIVLVFSSYLFLGSGLDIFVEYRRTPTYETASA